MIICHLLHLALIATLHIPQDLQVAVPRTTLKNSAEDHISLIEREIHDEGMLRLPFQLQIIHKCKLGIEDAKNIGPRLQQIILLFPADVCNLLDAVRGASIDNVHDLILVGYLGIRRGNDFILLENLIFVVGLVYPSDVFDDVFGKL